MSTLTDTVNRVAITDDDLLAALNDPDKPAVPIISLEKLRDTGLLCQDIKNIEIAESLCTDTRSILNVLHPLWLMRGDDALSEIKELLNEAFGAALEAATAVVASLNPDDQGQQEKLAFALHLQRNIDWRTRQVHTITATQRSMADRRRKLHAIVHDDVAPTLPVQEPIAI